VEERRWVERCLHADVPLAQVARIMGCSLREIEQRLEVTPRSRAKHNWSNSERQELKRLYGSNADTDLARRFGCSVQAIRSLAMSLHLSKNKAYLSRNFGKGATHMPRWRPAEIERLRQLYPTVSNLALARELGRSVSSIVSKAHLLGLKKAAERLAEMGSENVRVRYVVPVQAGPRRSKRPSRRT
jgi:hypothetical protein